MRISHHDLSAHAQSGVALVISLIFLVLLTLGGIAAMSTSTLEEKMSGNLKDQHIAFQSSESALRDGEQKLRDLATAASTQPAASATGAGGIWSGNSAGLNVTDADWWKTNGTEFGGSGKQLTETAQDPKYVIEEREFEADNLVKRPPTGVQYYRITAHGVGSTENAQAVVQSTMQIRYQ